MSDTELRSILFDCVVEGLASDHQLNLSRRINDVAHDIVQLALRRILATGLEVRRRTEAH
jgi:hypothetical protein